MLLSFSVPAMLPYLRAGVAEANGETLAAGTRVKRQTFCKIGPRGEALLEHARRASWTIPYDLHLWWKSRTPQRERIGTVRNARVYPVTILHSTVDPLSAPAYPVLRLNGPRGWRLGDDVCFWSDGDGDNAFAREVRADGFDSVETFRDFFVPNVGDRFDAILYKW